MAGTKRRDEVKVFDEELVFEEPPSKEKEVPVLKKLIEHPDRWVKVAWYPGKTTGYNRARTLTQKPPLPGRWEFWGGQSDDDSEGGSVLHAKYLGPEKGDDAEKGTNGKHAPDHAAARAAAAAASE